MKLYSHKNGSYTTFEKLSPSGMYLVKLHGTDGSIVDKVRCDDYRNARDYLKSFNAIAKAAK